jgi:hypothetical protein
VGVPSLLSETVTTTQGSLRGGDDERALPDVQQRHLSIAG